MRRPIFLLSLLSLLPLAVRAADDAPSSTSQLSVEERRSMQRETRIAIDFLENYHYKKMPWVEVDSKQLLMDYLEALDDQHMFLLQEDVDFILERFERNLKPSYLFVGDLYPAFEIFDLYKERVLARLDWIDERMKGDFDLTTDETINIDREGAPWPASADDADAIWEKRLTFDLIGEVLENEPLASAKEKISKRFERRRRSLDEFEPHNIQETFLTTLTELYDPHSTFFSWDSAQEFDIEITNSLTGIGAQLREVEGYCVVERLLPGGPAELSGQLHPGDKIVAVAQGDGEPVDVIGLKLRHIVHQIRGEIGTKVRLTIEPPEGDSRRFVSLTRDRVELSANLAKAEVFEVPGDDRTRQIGVIDLPSFYGEGDADGNGTSTSHDVAELLDKLKDYGIEGLILDLRRNGGGRLDEAVALTGLFIEEGPVVMKRSYDGNVEEDWDRDANVAYGGPLVVLTSKLSASASEIMAGALQSYNRAVIVGDVSTYGKGTVQTLVPLDRAIADQRWKTKPQWGMLKLTIQQFYLPDGASTQKRGVLSDITLPSLDSSSFIETEAEKEHALEWDSLSPISFNSVESVWTKPVQLISEELLSTLRDRSLARQSSLPEFDFYQRQLDWRTHLFEKDIFSLNLDAREAEQKEQEAQRDAFEDERKALSKELGFEATDVDLAISTEQETVHQQKLRETPLPDGKPRMNRFYQKVFYYQAAPEDEIKEVWVEFIDYEDALKHTAELAKVFSENAGVEVSEDEMSNILLGLKNADHGGEFFVNDFFTNVLGDRISSGALEAGLSPFFKRIVELDPDILRDRPMLDIHLRESLRIVNDWIELADAPKTVEDASSLLAKSEEHKESEAASATNN